MHHSIYSQASKEVDKSIKPKMISLMLISLCVLMKLGNGDILHEVS